MGSRILIVDDEPYILRILSFKLRREGYSTCEARSAEEAEQKIAAHPIDLMVLDVGLATSTDGFDLAAKLRQQEATRDLPIIILTARGYSADVLRGRQVGAAGYITKPFSSEELVERVRAILG
jgi:DNA-binding response OmpR family regulator